MQMKAVCGVVCVGLFTFGLAPLPVAFSASLNREAKAFAQQYYLTKLANCGDFYRISNKSNTLADFVGFTFNIVPELLTTAENFNGMEWKGYTVVKAESLRVYKSTSGECQEWKDLTQWIMALPLMQQYQIGIRKKQGTWALSDPRPESEELKYSKPGSCPETRK